MACHRIKSWKSALRSICEALHGQAAPKNTHNPEPGNGFAQGQLRSTVRSLRMSPHWFFSCCLFLLTPFARNDGAAENLQI